MTENQIDILCNLTIDVALINDEAIDKIETAIENGSLEELPIKFINRIKFATKYCYNLFINACENTDDDEYSDDMLINLMDILVRYKNTYWKEAYAYKVMNSLLDAVKVAFIKFN